MSNNALVSVYITNYNYGQFIKRAIESVLNQTFQDFELIIIDDGSIDNSRNIIEAHSRHPKIKIIYQQNKGLNVTNNIALRSATGKYIIRLDADDYFHSEALETLSSRLEADDELGMIFGDYCIVDQNGVTLSEEKRHNFDLDVKLFDQPAHGACTMIRTSFLKHVGGYNESYNCQDGYELWVKFISRFKVTNINKVIFYYRKHGNNLTRSENKILDTRARINASFVKERAHNTDALAIIPVRGHEEDSAFKHLGGTSLLDIKIHQALGSKSIQKIIVTSPNKAVQRQLKAHSKIEFHLRDEHEARYNKSLDSTIDEIVRDQISKGLNFETIVLLTVEYPFVQSYKIDDAINTLLLFGSDSLIAVRPDNSIFYQHHGDGLHPILNRDKSTKLEREALFVQVGGISVSRKEVFLKSKKLISGILGHMVMDQKNAIGIFSEFDYELAKLLTSREKEIISGGY